MSLRRAAIALVVSSFCAVGVSELAAHVLARAGRIPFQQFRTTPAPAFWAYNNTSFGMWHVPGASFRHTTSCFDVIYHVNSYGARDVERARRSAAPRHVVLGDSLIEGWGIADGERMTDRLEASSGVASLDFGTAGGFGTVQEMMLYRTLASTFDHSDVLLFVLPANDFSDNDPAQYPEKRYRPYMRRRASGEYEIYYTVAFENRDQELLGPPARVLNEVSNDVVLLNLVRQTYGWWSHRHDTAPLYGSVDEQAIDVMGESIRELARDAGTHPVVVFLAPVQKELDAYLRTGNAGMLEAQLAASVKPAVNVRVVDLLPDFIAYARQHELPTSAFFHPCDEHWSPLGHAVAAEAVSRTLIR